MTSTPYTTTNVNRLTNSTDGIAKDTLAAGIGINIFNHPLTSLATGLSTSAIDIMTGYVPGFRFKVVGFDFITTVAGTGTSASQVFNIEIGTTNTTGGVLTLLLADTNAIGKKTAATAFTANNTGSATDAISIEMAASGTVFTAGAGYFAIKLVNLDTCDAITSLLSIT